MFNRDWLHNLALGGCLVFTYGALAQDQPSPPTQPAQEQTQPAAQPIPQPGSPLTPVIDGVIEKQAAADAARHAEERKDAREQADLVAQQAMAVASERMLILTVIQIIIGAVTLGFLYLTFREAKRTADAGIKAAEQAGVAADAARDALAVERAWVTHAGFNRSVTLNPTIHGKVYAKGVMIQQVWANTGRSPAVRLDLYVADKIIPAGHSAPVFEIPDRPEQRSGVMGPGTRVTTAWSGIPQEIAERVRNGELRWFIYSRATYGTITDPGANCISEVCAEIEYDGEIVRQDGTVTPNLTLSMNGAQNGAT